MKLPSNYILLFSLLPWGNLFWFILPKRGRFTVHRFPYDFRLKQSLATGLSWSHLIEEVDVGSYLDKLLCLWNCKTIGTVREGINQICFPIGQIWASALLHFPCNRLCLDPSRCVASCWWLDSKCRSLVSNVTIQPLPYNDGSVTR